MGENIIGNVSVIVVQLKILKELVCGQVILKVVDVENMMALNSTMNSRLKKL